MNFNYSQNLNLQQNQQNKIKRNHSQGYFSQIGNQTIPNVSAVKVDYTNNNDIHYYNNTQTSRPFYQNQSQIISPQQYRQQPTQIMAKFSNNSDLHYYNYKNNNSNSYQQPLNYAQHQMPINNIQQNKPQSINITLPQDIPYQQQAFPSQNSINQYNHAPAQINRSAMTINQIDPAILQKLQQAEQNNVILKAKMNNLSQYQPPNDILTHLGSRVQEQKPQNPQQQIQYMQQPIPQQQPQIIIVNDNPGGGGGGRRRSPPREQYIFQPLPPQIIYQQVEPEKHIIKEIIREMVPHQKQKRGSKRRKSSYVSDDIQSLKSQKRKKSSQKSKVSLNQLQQQKKDKKENKEDPKQKKQNQQCIRISLNKLSEYNDNPKIFTKHAITFNEDFQTDVDGNPCSGEEFLKTTKIGPSEIKIDYQHTYKINYSQIANSLEDDKQVFIFIAFYDNNQTKVIGWVIQPIFIYTDEDTFQVNKGIFRQNIFKPPLQGPPFLSPKEKSVEIIELGITDEFSEFNQLQLIDLVEQILEDDNLNLQVIIKSINGYTKEGIIKYQVEINDPENNILDRDDNACISQGEFQKDFNELNKQITFNVGENYLRNITDPISRAEYIISVNLYDQQNEQLGFIDIPLFESQVKLQLGEITEELEQPVSGKPTITIETKLVKQ